MYVCMYMCVCINRGASKSYQNIKKIVFTEKIQNSLPSKSEGLEVVLFSLFVLWNKEYSPDTNYKKKDSFFWIHLSLFKPLSFALFAMGQTRGLVTCLSLFLFMGALPRASHGINPDTQKSLTYALYFLILALIYRTVSRLPLLPGTIIVCVGVNSSEDNDVVFLESPTNRASAKLTEHRIKNEVDGFVP